MMVKSSESRMVMPLNGLHLNAIRIKGTQKNYFYSGCRPRKALQFLTKNPRSIKTLDQKHFLHSSSCTFLFLIFIPSVCFNFLSAIYKGHSLFSTSVICEGHPINRKLGRANLFDLKPFDGIGLMFSCGCYKSNNIEQTFKIWNSQTYLHIVESTSKRIINRRWTLKAAVIIQISLAYPPWKSCTGSIESKSIRLICCCYSLVPIRCVEYLPVNRRWTCIIQWL